MWPPHESRYPLLHETWLPLGSKINHTLGHHVARLAMYRMLLARLAVDKPDAVRSLFKFGFRIPDYQGCRTTVPAMTRVLSTPTRNTLFESTA